MNIRRTTEEDIPALRELYAAFEAELPPAPYFGDDLEEELREMEEIVRGHESFVAEDDGAIVGFALARKRDHVHARLTDLYVVPESRGRGVAAALVREVVGAYRRDGVEYLSLDVMIENAAARAVYARWGFREYELKLAAPLSHLEERLRGRTAPSFGSIHVQTDDAAAVERAVRQFVRGLGRSQGSVVVPERGGWTAVYDELCDREPKLLRRLARELSDRMGNVVLALGVEEGAVVRFVLFERGKVMDEYLSVQEYYGPLPPGDVVALAANPRVVARLTGAEPAAVRSAAVHAKTPEELPPPAEIAANLARAMGVEGADHGWSETLDVPGAVRIART